MLEAALAYLDRGWSILPLYAPNPDGSCTCDREGCTSAGKHPAIFEWRTYYQRRATPEEASVWFSGPPRNIGVVSGQVSNGLVIIDCDDQTTYDALCYCYRELGESLTAVTGKGHHVYCHAEQATPTVGFKANGHLHHVRADSVQSVAPPSVHASGRTYRWQDQDAVLLELDLSRLAAALARIGGKKDEPRGQTSSSEFLQWLKEGARQGERDERTFRLASHLSYRLPEDEVEELLTLWAEQRCDQPWGREDVRAKLRSGRRH